MITMILGALGFIWGIVKLLFKGKPREDKLEKQLVRTEQARVEAEIGKAQAETENRIRVVRAQKEAKVKDMTTREKLDHYANKADSDD